MKIEKLPTCECGVPTDGGEDVQPCGKGAVVIISWGHEKLYVCEEHFETMDCDHQWITRAESRESVTYCDKCGMEKQE